MNNIISFTMNNIVISSQQTKNSCKSPRRVLNVSRKDFIRRKNLIIAVGGARRGSAAAARRRCGLEAALRTRIMQFYFNLRPQRVREAVAGRGGPSGLRAAGSRGSREVAIKAAAHTTCRTFFATLRDFPRDITP